jgi:hypothetical protein
MSSNDFDERASQLAVEIEQAIEEGEEFLEQLPEFAPRSQRSRKMQQAIQNGP